MTEPKLEVKKEDGYTTERTRPRPRYHQLQNNNQDQGGKLQSDKIITPRANFKGELPELEGAYFDFLPATVQTYMRPPYASQADTLQGNTTMETILK